MRGWMCTLTCGHTNAGRHHVHTCGTYTLPTRLILISWHTQGTTGTNVCRNTGIRRHTYRHVLLSLHPVSTRLLANVYALKMRIYWQVSKCRPSWIQECTHTEHTHVPFYIQCYAQHSCPDAGRTHGSLLYWGTCAHTLCIYLPVVSESVLSSAVLTNEWHLKALIRHGH